MASTIQVDKVQDTGGNTILSSNSTGTFTYEAASGANFTALDADNVSAGTLATGRMAAGTVVQVVSTTKTDTYSEAIAARGTGSDITGLTATITPTSASSKLLIYSTLHTSREGGYGYANFIIHRDGSAVLVGDTDGSRLPVTVGDNIGVTNAVAMFNTCSFGQVDASSTSATTFSVRLENAGSSGTKTFYVNRSVTDTDANSYTRAISSIMVMEVLA